MAFIQDSLGGVSGGVSQQPDILRYPGQCTLQENMIIDVVEGLRRRGEVTLLKILDDQVTDDDAAYHWFSLEDREYVARFHATGIDVYDMDGNHYPVTVPSYAYLTTSYNNIRSAQVGEYNIIAAPDVKVSMDSNINTKSDEYVTFHIKDGMTWGLRVTISWNGVSIADYTCPAGDTVDSTTIEQTSSIYVATELYNDLVASLSGSDWGVVRLDNTIVMHRIAANYHPDKRANLFAIDDSGGGSSCTCIIDSIQTLDKLPPRSTPGHWVRVSGKESSSIDDFYMKYETSDNTVNANGVWKECAKPTEMVQLKPTTMPHALVRVENGEFYFTALDGNVYGGSQIDVWKPRKAGDKDSNPEPAFVGEYITDVTIVQQRLALVSDDHVSFSKAQAEFDYFSTSALTGTDTDPIELITPGERAAHLFAAIEHDQNLLVLGNRRQFAIPLTKALTPENAALVPTTAYDVDGNCRPTAVGGGMFFAFSDRIRTGVREYRTVDIENIHIADEVSANLGEYLPTHIKSLHSDRQLSMVFALPEDGEEVFVYQFLNQDNERVLSAWYQLNFPFIRISSMSSIDGHFYFMAYGDNGLGLYRLEKPGDVFLDYQCNQPIQADGVVDLSTWAFKDIVDQSDIIAVLDSGTWKGLQVEIDTYTPSTGELVLKEPEIFQGEDLIVGVYFDSNYIPTMPVLRDKKGKAKQLDYLTVNFIEITVANTTNFEAIIRAPYYDDTIQKFTGRFVGSTFIVGENPPSDRKELVSVGHNAREVDVLFRAYKHTDFVIQALEYKGNYTQRGQRM